MNLSLTKDTVLITLLIQTTSNMARVHSIPHILVKSLIKLQKYQCNPIHRKNLFSDPCWQHETRTDLSVDSLRTKLNLGMFYSKLAPWVQTFGFNRVHLVDGANLGNQSGARNDSI